MPQFLSRWEKLSRQNHFSYRQQNYPHRLCYYGKYTFPDRSSCPATTYHHRYLRLDTSWCPCRTSHRLSIHPNKYFHWNSNIYRNLACHFWPRPRSPLRSGRDRYRYPRLNDFPSICRNIFRYHWRCKLHSHRAYRFRLWFRSRHYHRGITSSLYPLYPVILR